MVSLSLFLAALRDNFAQWDGYEDDAEEVAVWIFSKGKRSEDPVTRIEWREKNGKYLKCVLSKRDLDGNPLNDLRSLIPPNKKSWNSYAPYDKCMFQVYTYFYDQIQERRPEIAAKLMENFQGNVYLLLLIPPDTRTARNMVMSQGKGKDAELVDEFKGMACFNFIDKEHEQDLTLERWNQLCHEVERKTVQDKERKICCGAGQPPAGPES